ncbi:NUDIX hydrolase [uncultured Traorella sp.]|uniref:NUDIX hydrolase n=1 Tax=uncultured Traorella sp. TaxID=1929048 RepID=UPI0025DCD955|nr:NUDIX hydrolase [uncultured Traorella sp.]
MEKQLNSQLIYDGRVIKVTKDEVLCENGTTSYRECVKAPGGVAILAIKDHAILLVRQYRYVVSEETIEIPAGKIEPNEDLAVCASRELEEETGYKAEEMIRRFTFYPTPGFCGEVLHIYEAKNLTKVEHPKAMDEDECINSYFLDLDEAYQQVMNGTIRDSKTIIAIQYAIQAYNKISD